MRQPVVTLGLILLLASCRQTLEADVTRFSSLPADWRGQTFVVLPDPGQDDSLEFRAYAGLVTDGLQSHGLEPARRGAELAKIIVTVHCAGVGTRTEYWFDPGTNWAGWGGIDDGTLYSHTFFLTALDVELYDAAAWRKGRRLMLFQGHVLGQSDIGSLNRTMPYLVQALFAGFPGADHQTVSVTVPMAGG